MDIEENKINENESWEEFHEEDKRKKTVSFKAAAIVTAIAVIVSACLACFGTVVLINSSGYNGLGLEREAWEKLKWGFKSVKDVYYEKIDDSKLVDGALLGMSMSLDDYTLYMSKKDAKNFLQSVDADSYSGVGLYIYNNTKDNTVTVLSPLSGSPAEKAGIKTGDKIIAVDQTAVTGADLEKTSDMMMGKEGTKVSVTVLKADTGKTEVIELVREKIKLETVYSEMFEDNIGYIQITQFGVNTYSEFVEHYNKLSNEGMNKLVIDLRNNVGGYFEQAVNIADIFIDRGDVIVYTKDKNGKKEEYKAQTKAVDIETAILCNGGTASASEVLIGALCDHDKAILVGEKTYGKGVTQALVTNKDGSAFKITDTKYYTPRGNCIDKKGITPDIKADDSAQGDLVLDAAVEALK